MFRNLQTDKFNRTSFEVNNVDLSIVNAIRRIILTDIPVIAFDGEEHPSLKIIKNDGPLHNEFILHRFGLIPIHFSEEETDNFVPEDYTFELKVTNEGAKTLNVTSHDIIVYKNGTAMSSKDTVRLFPPNAITKDFILITRVRKGESLHVTGQVVKSTARDHAGFSPVSLCNFRLVQDPVESTKAQGILDKERAFMKDKYGDPTSYIFDIETETGLGVKYLVQTAIDILATKVNKVLQDIGNDDSEDITKTLDNGMEFTFQDEDDTLGCYLQSCLHSHYIRNANITAMNKEVTYAGYYCPHPLDNVMKIKLCIGDGDTEASQEEYIEVMTEQCRRCIAELEHIKAEWIKLNS